MMLTGATVEIGGASAASTPIPMLVSRSAMMELRKCCFVVRSLLDGGFDFFTIIGKIRC